MDDYQLIKITNRIIDLFDEDFINCVSKVNFSRLKAGLEETQDHLVELNRQLTRVHSRVPLPALDTR